MRQVVLDTETTGLDWRTGDRVVEIGCVELLNRRRSGRTYHAYLNPERDMPADAERVHGLSSDFLADKPLFADVADAFCDFVRDAEIIIHNAAFDVGFLDHELSRLRRGGVGELCAGVVVTLLMAREQNPGKKASLDALCERYEIDNAHRTLHGALLDAEILADVYLAMTRGQESLMIAFDDLPGAVGGVAQVQRPRGPLKVLRASAGECAAHEAVLDAIAKATKGACLWRGGAEPPA